MKSSDGKSGSLDETAEAVSMNNSLMSRIVQYEISLKIRNRGGQCIPVRVDHEKSRGN